MADGRHLENRKIAISPDEILHGDAYLASGSSKKFGTKMYLKTTSGKSVVDVVDNYYLEFTKLLSLYSVHAYAHREILHNDAQYQSTKYCPHDSFQNVT